MPTWFIELDPTLCRLSSLKQTAGMPTFSKRMVFWECLVILRESSFEDVALASIATAKAIRQQRHHSLRLRGLVNLRHRQACDSAEQFTRSDIRPDAPGSDR